MRAKGLRLGRAQPYQLGQVKAGDGGVAGAGDEALAGNVGFDLGDRLAGALVVPQDGGADHLALGVERHHAVHLTRQAERRDVVLAQLGSGFSEGGQRLAQPVGGILFGPAGSGGEQRVAAGHLGDHQARLVRGQYPHAAGAEIDPQRYGRH